MPVRAVQIRHDSSIAHAAEIVALSRASDLMVVDDEDNVRGVLSEGDILRTAPPDIDEILQEWGSLDDAHEVFVRKGRLLSDLPITSLVIEEPIVIDTNDHLAKAAVAQVDRRIRLLPVVHDGKLVGTVHRAEVCRAIVGTL